MKRSHLLVLAVAALIWSAADRTATAAYAESHSSHALIDRLWPEATPLADGWYEVDWYGYVRPAGDWIYHIEHGWQYCMGGGGSSLFAYDANLMAWGWTAAGTYPTFYWYWPVEDWALYRRPGAPGHRIFYHYGESAWRHETRMADPVFISGELRSILVTAPSGDSPIVVSDGDSGHSFSVPAGESGTIRLAPMDVHYPAPPHDGEGWIIEPEGLSEMKLVLEATGNEDTAPIVYAFTDMQGAFSDSIGYGQMRWVALHWEELKDGRSAYAIPFPDSDGAETMSVGSEVLADQDDMQLPQNYWISRVDPNSALVQQRSMVRLQVDQYVESMLAELDPALRSEVETRREESRLRFAYGGNYYTGFNKLRIRGTGRRFRPVLAITSPTNAGALAHETGHYMTHLLAGHDAYDQLERRGGSLFSGQHGIQDDIGRNNLLEDYAYYLESFLIGSGGKAVLDNPRSTFRDLSARTRDFPGIEGFAASMLALLHYEEHTLRDSFNISWPIAPLGLTRGAVFAIVAQGRTSVEALRREIEQSLAPERKKAFQVLLHRLGWQYAVEGRIVDGDGAPLAGIEVESVVEVDGQSYFGTFTRVVSDDDGRFWLDTFGGHSALLLTTGAGGKTDEFPVTIDWSEATDQRIDLGELVVDEGSEVKVFRDSWQRTYTKTTSGWPEGVEILFGGYFTAVVTHTDAASARMKRVSDHDHIVTWEIHVPVGAKVHVSGTFHVLPSAMSGRAQEGQWRLIWVPTVEWRLDPVGEEGLVSHSDTIMTFNYETPPLGNRDSALARFHKRGRFERYSESQDSWFAHGFGNLFSTYVRLVIETE